MNKQQEFNNMSGNQPHPSAPPSYDEAVFKQPAYNPNVPSPYGYNPQMAMQNPVQAAPAFHPQPPPTVVYTTAPAAPQLAVSVGPRPATIECPFCHKRVKTIVTTESQKSAHLAALVLCLLGCWVCCCIPYCMASFQNYHHKCPDCKAFIGTYKA